MKRIQLFYLILSFFLFYSCDDGKPKNLIAEDEFVSILIDIHILDAVSSDYMINNLIGDLDSAVIYSSVLKKHNLNYNSFSNSLKYYSSQPELFKDIYDEVYTEITKKLEHYKQLDVSTNDADRFWRHKKNINIKGDSLNYPDPFLVPIDTIGTYTLKFSLRLQPADSSKNPYIMAYFLKDTIDKPEDRIYLTQIPLIKTDHSRQFQFSKELKDSTYKFMNIILPECENRDSLHHKSLTINNLEVLRSRKKAK